MTASPYFSPADAHTRERALDPGRSFIVEAPAGSGKTTLLTQRFLRLLSIVEEPESIVAITFTRKAAEEMRGRVLGALKAARENPEALDPVSRQWAGAALAASDAKAWRLLESPRRLRVQTIDSLSATLARRGPLMSGYAGNAEVLEDAGPHYRQAARAAISTLGEKGEWSDSIRTLLRHLDNDWERLEGLLAEMLSRRDQWLRFVVNHPDREVFEVALEAAVCDELRRIAEALPPRLHADIVRVCAFAGANLNRDYPTTIGAGLAGLETMPGDDCADLIVWQAIANVFLKRDGDIRQRLSKKEGFPAGGPAVKEHKTLFASLATELADMSGFVVALDEVRGLPQPSYTDAKWRSIEALFVVLKLAAAELKVTFGSAGAVDFVEVAHAALAALGAAQAPSDLGLILDYQIQHLLIDEFQDTSITQFELIERLLDGWSEGDGRSLFLVGDPMQSIYRFRQAEVSLFINTGINGRIAAVPLDSLQLTTNFRAQAAVIDWINETLEKMRVDPACPFAHIPRLVAARAATASPAVHTYALNADEEDAESSTVVEIVKRTQAEYPDYRIGILVRGRRHLGSISSALQEAGVAVSASEIERLCDQAIVQDLVALTRALLHPADRTAWLGALRAPWCGLSLKSMAGLFEGATETTVWQRLTDGLEGHEIPSGEHGLVANFARIMDIALMSVGREPIAPLLERTWIALGGPSAYLDANLTHAERYFELLSGCERRETLITATRLDDLLDRQYVSPSSHAESAVEIMTVHRAKGLEFDVVIVPGLGRVPRPEPHRLLAWRRYIGPSGAGLLFAPIPRIGASDDDIHAYLHRAEKKELEDEAYRLLYVALTRAREAVHLVASIGEHPKGGPAAPASRSFLGMLWNAIGDGLEYPVPAHPPASSVTDIGSGARQQIRRLQAGSERHPGDSLTGAIVAPRAEIEFAWASPIAKHVGTVTHAILQLICGDGLSKWNVARAESLVPYIEGRLRGIGVNRTDILGATERILAAVTGVLESDRGRWIMSERHDEAESEYALTSVVDGKVVNAIIDRTFVDAEGIRWIIDFKTGTHTGGSKDAFIASEVERYRPQLERYAQLLRARDDRPVELGLFFPLLDGWSAWHYSDERAGR